MPQIFVHSKSFCWLGLPVLSGSFLKHLKHLFQIPDGNFTYQEALVTPNFRHSLIFFHLLPGAKERPQAL